MTKVCLKCKKELPLTTEYFHKRIDSKDGFRNSCKNCLLSEQRCAYRENNIKFIERSRRYYENNKESISKKTKIKRKTNKGNINILTLEDFKEIYITKIKPKLRICENGCWEWDYSNSKGYGQIRVMAGKGSVLVQTHRVSKMVSENRIIISDECVCHSCDNPKCNNPEHLFTGSQIDNIADMNTKGRQGGTFKKGHINKYEAQVRGEKTPISKLEEDDIKEIFRLKREEGLGYKRIAKIYGLSPETIRAVLKRRTWKHVEV